MVNLRWAFFVICTETVCNCTVCKFYLTMLAQLPFPYNNRWQCNERDKYKSTINLSLDSYSEWNQCPIKAGNCIRERNDTCSQFSTTHPSSLFLTLFSCNFKTLHIFQLAAFAPIPLVSWFQLHPAFFIARLPIARRRGAITLHGNGKVSC